MHVTVTLFWGLIMKYYNERSIVGFNYNVCASETKSLELDDDVYKNLVAWFGDLIMRLCHWCWIVLDRYGKITSETRFKGWLWNIHYD